MKTERIALVIRIAALVAAPALASPAEAKDLMSADGPGGTYELLGRSYGIEVPDCGHMVPHITEEMDTDLGKPVFVFHAHVAQDDDRCGKTDRQRTELRGKTSGVGGPLGSTRYYRWKFKLPTGFRASGSFTHIFQIKAYGNGHGSGAPIMTLTPRSDTFAIDGRIGKHGTTSLGKFLGTWVVVDMKIVHANAGRIEATIRNLKTAEMLFTYAGNHDMWDDGAADGMPKFGIYRSLNDRGALRDEQVRFADFCVSQANAAECAEGSLPPPPPAPDGGTEPDPGDAGPSPDSDIGPDEEPDAGTPDAKGPTPKPAAPDAAAGSPATPPKIDAGAAPPSPEPTEEDPPRPASSKASGCSAAPGAPAAGWGALLALSLLLMLRRRFSNCR